MTKFTTALISTLVATAALAGTAVANESRYEGAQRNAAAVSNSGPSYDHTGSVSHADLLRLTSDKPRVDSGDYYEGAIRPV